MTRMQLTWIGTPAPTQAVSRKAFLLMVIITSFHYGMSFMTGAVVGALDPNDYSKPDYPEFGEERLPLPFAAKFLQQLNGSLNFIYVVYVIVIGYHIRSIVRQTYAIPGSSISDCISSCICLGCCGNSQLLRHTTDYSIYASHVCSANGLQQQSMSDSDLRYATVQQQPQASSVVVLPAHVASIV
jgi:hypothetical protein